MTLQQFNNKYKYRPDINYDDWSECKEAEGLLQGDCESYCISLKKRVEGFEDFRYYFCYLNGAGHCVLFKNGDVIDCNTQKIVSFEQYCKMYKVTDFKKYNWFVVFSKILFSKAYVWIHSLKN